MDKRTGSLSLLDAGEAGLGAHKAQLDVRVKVLQSAAQTISGLERWREEAFGHVEVVNEPVRTSHLPSDVEAPAEGASRLEHAEGLCVGSLLVREGVKAVE